MVSEMRSPLCHLPSLLVADIQMVQEVSNKQILLFHYERTLTRILKLHPKPSLHHRSDRLERLLHLPIHMIRLLQKNLIK